jgi:hypothetical protein
MGKFIDKGESPVDSTLYDHYDPNTGLRFFAFTCQNPFFSQVVVPCRQHLATESKWLCDDPDDYDPHAINLAVLRSRPDSVPRDPSLNGLADWQLAGYCRMVGANPEGFMTDRHFAGMLSPTRPIFREAETMDLSRLLINPSACAGEEVEEIFQQLYRMVYMCAVSRGARYVQFVTNAAILRKLRKLFRVIQLGKGPCKDLDGRERVYYALALDMVTGIELLRQEDPEMADFFEELPPFPAAQLDALQSLPA